MWLFHYSQPFPIHLDFYACWMEPHWYNLRREENKSLATREVSRVHILILLVFFCTVSLLSAKNKNKNQESTDHQPQINGSSVTPHPYYHGSCVCVRLAVVPPDFLKL